MKIVQQVMVVCALGLFVFCASGPAQGQVPAGPPPKWVQPPDMTPMGLDVKATEPVILADDFLCTNRGFITNIQVWGSWLGDYLPSGNAAAVAFRLQIYGDIPDPDPQYPLDWSMPAETVLWEKMFYSAGYPTTFTVEPYYTLPSEPEGEGWFDPLSYIYTPDADYTIWRYNFDIPLTEAFEQLGTPGAPVVYWLALEAFVQDPEAQFGWKSSSQHWNDDAVWRYDSSNPPGGDLTFSNQTVTTVPLWGELRYPYDHELAGQSIDLAFVIAPEPITLTVLALGMLPAVLLKRKRTL